MSLAPDSPAGPCGPASPASPFGPCGPCSLSNLGNFRLQRLDLGVLGLELCDVVCAASAHRVLLGFLLVLFLPRLRVDARLLPVLLLVLVLSDLVLRLLHAT